MMIRCCQESFCYECIREALLKTESQGFICPKCGKDGQTTDSLVPNKKLRDSVNWFRKQATLVAKNTHVTSSSASMVIKNSQINNPPTPMPIVYNKPTYMGNQGEPIVNEIKKPNEDVKGSPQQALGGKKTPESGGKKGDIDSELDSLLLEDINDIPGDDKSVSAIEESKASDEGKSNKGEDECDKKSQLSFKLEQKLDLGDTHSTKSASKAEQASVKPPIPDPSNIRMAPSTGPPAFNPHSAVAAPYYAGYGRGGYYPPAPARGYYPMEPYYMYYQNPAFPHMGGRDMYYGGRGRPLPAPIVLEKPKEKTGENRDRRDRRNKEPGSNDNRKRSRTPKKSRRSRSRSNGREKSNKRSKKNRN